MQVHIRDIKPGGAVAVGLGPRDYNMTRQPGWDVGSCAYHGDDGMLFHESGNGKQPGPLFGAGDIVGCGLDVLHHEVCHEIACIAARARLFWWMLCIVFDARSCQILS